MGRGSSKVGGRSSSGASGSLSTNSALYDVKPTDKAIREALKEVPNGTIFAFKYPTGNQFVMEKVGEDAMNRPIVMQTRITDDGIGTNYATDAVSSIKNALKSKDVKLGLDDDELKKVYKKHIDEHKKAFGFK